jgi:transcriptional regulator GlxA family with amidase domain
MFNATVFYSPDGPLSSSVAPLEVFYTAGSKWNLCVTPVPEPRFSLTTVSVDGKPVTGGAGVQVMPDKAIDEIEQTDIVFVPAMGGDIDVILKQNVTTIPWLQKLYERGAMIAGVCTGVALMAEAGLLDGRRATTYWAAADTLQRRYPKVDWQPKLAVTEDCGVLCSGGLYASIDLALYIVERMCGREVALRTARTLVVEMPRTYQTGYSILPFGSDHADTTIRRAEDWLHDHFPDDIDLDQVATDVALSPRTFLRRFKSATGETPLAYLQRLRTEAARRMLEEDRMTVQEVGLAVGYEDVAFFRDLFKRHVGISPGAYRERYAKAMEVRLA